MQGLLTPTAIELYLSQGALDLARSALDRLRASAAQGGADVASGGATGGRAGGVGGARLDALEQRLEALEARRREVAVEVLGGWLGPGAEATMGFREHLEKIASRVDGALAVSLMATDGIAVDTYEVPDPGIDVSGVLVEVAALVEPMARMVAANGVGSLEEFVVRGEKAEVVVRILTPEYLVAVAFAPGASRGKARYALRVAMPAIRAEL